MHVEVLDLKMRLFQGWEALRLEVDCVTFMPASIQINHSEIMIFGSEFFTNYVYYFDVKQKKLTRHHFETVGRDTNNAAYEESKDQPYLL